MKTTYSILFTLMISICAAQDKTAGIQVKKTSFNEAATALSDKSVADFFPMHDKQVNDILRLCDKGGDIKGSVKALISLGVYLGSDLDLEEEQVIIRGSKVDVLVYDDICKNIILSFSKPLNSSIEEAENIIKSIEDGKGNDILTGIKILAKGKYRMRRGPELTITPEQLNLWAEIGKTNEKEFEEIYKALLLVGLNPELNFVSTNAILDLMKKNKAAEITKTTEVLNATGWRCEGEFDMREAQIIENIINNKYEDTNNTSVTEKL